MSVVEENFMRCVLVEHHERLTQTIESNVKELSD